MTPIYLPLSGIIGWTLRDEEERTEVYDLDGRLTAIDSPVFGRLTVNYDESDRLQTVTDRHGRSLAFGYDAEDRLSSLSGPDGVEFGYSYDGNGNLIAVTYPTVPSGQEVQRQYHYEDANLVHALTGITDESGGRYASWSYDALGRATLSVHGDITGSIDRVQLTYNSDGTTTVLDALGTSRNFTFSQSFGVKRFGNVTKPCMSCGGAVNQARSYDANGFTDIDTDFDGTTIDYDHNTRGLVVQKVEAANDVTGKKRTIQTDWHASLNDPIERRSYDASGELVSKLNRAYTPRGQRLTQTQTDPVLGVSRTVATAYCEQADITAGTCPLLGLIKSTDGPRTDVGDIASYAYRMNDEGTCGTSPATCPYRKGDLWKVTNALGHVTETLRYDGAGRVLSVKNPNGVITDFEYHPRGWLIARKERGTNNSVETDDRITRIEYWPTGLVRQVTQPDGSFTAYAYDAAHRLTDIFDGDGNRIQYTLDNAGNRTQEDTTDEQGTLLRTLSRVYNQLSQLQTQKDANQQPTGFTYDANGNTDTITDALGRVTDHDYGPLNRLQRTLQDVDGIEAETKFEYDSLDNLTKVTDPKELDTDYTYNAFGDLLTLSSPDTGTTSYTYDSAGNRMTQTDARGVVTTYTYDVLNRLKTLAYSDGSPGIAYEYDTKNGVACGLQDAFYKGRLNKITDGSGKTEYCYNRFGHLTAKKQTTNSKTFMVRYTYTETGNLRSVTYPDGGLVDYIRNAQGQVTEVGVKPAGGTRQALLREATYYPFGPVAEWVYGNGRLMRRSLNQNYQPGFVEDPFAGGISIGYEFDAVGNLAKLRSANQTNPPQRLFGYDDLNRLTEVKDGSTQALLQGYDYDPTGNRESATLGSTVVDYIYPTGNHRLSTVGGTGRSYDNAGNTTAIGGSAKEYVYNAANRMQQVKQGGAATMSYAYNGRGEQVRKYLGSGNTYTVYDEAGRWLGDYDSSGVAKQQAIWLDDLPVGLLVGSGASQKLHYVQPDALGTPRVVIDPSAGRDVAVWKWELTGEAFGNTAPNQDPDGDGSQFVFDMRFPGQRYDAASGFNYNYFRDYEAGTGRYVQSDPIGLLAGVSTFLYADGDPLMNRDPLGLATDRPGEYCTFGRCGPPPPVGNSWCGESCKTSCRRIFALQMDQFLNNFVNSNACDIWEYVDSDQQTACQMMQQAVYFRDRARIQRQLRECIAGCVPCPCGGT